MEQRWFVSHNPEHHLTDFQSAAQVQRCQEVRDIFSSLAPELEILSEDFVHHRLSDSSVLHNVSHSQSLIIFNQVFDCCHIGWGAPCLLLGSPLQVHNGCATTCKAVPLKSDAANTEDVGPKDSRQCSNCVLLRPSQLHQEMDVNPLDELQVDLLHSFHLAEWTEINLTSKRHIPITLCLSQSDDLLWLTSRV